MNLNLNRLNSLTKKIKFSIFSILYNTCLFFQCFRTTHIAPFSECKLSKLPNWFTFFFLVPNPTFQTFTTTKIGKNRYFHRFLLLLDLLYIPLIVHIKCLICLRKSILIIFRHFCCSNSIRCQENSY